MIAHVEKRSLKFITPGGTSRGILTSKNSWFLKYVEAGRLRGIGECSIIEGLSPDNPLRVENLLLKSLENKEDSLFKEELRNFPAVRFAIETCHRGTLRTEPYSLFDSAFLSGTEGLPINGLIWMGEKEDMRRQVKQKIELGFRCLKLKIGAIDWDDELDLIASIRKEYTADDIELRVDANGAFEADEALDILKRLSEFQLHSIEQPIRPGQLKQLAHLCEYSPLSVALDEELIGIADEDSMDSLLELVRPDYIIIKPSLIGGFEAGSKWIRKAEERQIGWWVTSALESNLGLNAIAQWTACLGVQMPQGLGTGQLFSNNIRSPLEIRDAHLFYNPDQKWSDHGFKVD